MKRFAFAGLMVLYAMLSPAHAQVVWNSGPGANGHTYQPIVVSSGITWTQADTAATAAGGYLATITTPEENAFVFSLIDAPQFWQSDVGFNNGPWLGGRQTAKTDEPAGNWTWVTGEPFGFQAWAPGEPNNTGNTEDFLHFNQFGTGRSATWNDASDFSPIISYVIEFGAIASAAPEPATAALLLTILPLAFTSAIRACARRTSVDS